MEDLFEVDSGFGLSEDSPLPERPVVLSNSRDKPIQSPLLLTYFPEALVWSLDVGWPLANSITLAPKTSKDRVLKDVF